MLLHQYLPPQAQRIETLEKNKLWFSNPYKFNDPFELSASLNGKLTYSPENLNEIIEAYLNGATGLLPRLVSDEIIDSLKKGVKKGKYINNWDIAEDIEQLFKSQLRRQGIACLSRDSNNELMWAYYAQGHSGFKVSYQVKQMTTLLESGVMTVDVNYTNHKPEMTILDFLFTDTLGKMLATKSIHWAHENEVRLIKEFPSEFQSLYGTAIDMPIGVEIVEVTAAVRMTSSDFESLENAVRQLETAQKKSIKMSKVCIPTETYTLEIIEHSRS